MIVHGFQTLAKGTFGVAVLLQDGTSTHGLYDHATKAESLTKFESQVLAGTPSVVMEENLRIGDRVEIARKTYEIRDLETDPDGYLTRYFLILLAET